MADFVVPLRKEIKDSLARQDVQDIRSLHKKGLAEKEKRNKYFFLRENTKNWQS